MFDIKIYLTKSFAISRRYLIVNQVYRKNRGVQRVLRSVAAPTRITYSWSQKLRYQVMQTIDIHCVE